MDYSAEFLENVMYAGKMGLTLPEIKYAFEIENWKQFSDDFNTPGSEIHETYKFGVVSAQFEIEKALLAGAAAGDKDSIELLWKIQNKREAIRDRNPILEN